MWEGAEMCLVMRQEFKLEGIDEGLGAVYQKYSVYLDSE